MFQSSNSKLAALLLSSTLGCGGGPASNADLDTTQPSDINAAASGVYRLAEFDSTISLELARLPRISDPLLTLRPIEKFDFEGVDRNSRLYRPAEFPVPEQIEARVKFWELVYLTPKSIDCLSQFDRAVANQEFIGQGEIPRSLIEEFRRELRGTQPGRREVFEQAIVRSGSYLPYIIEEFEKFGLPREMAALAIVESGLNNEAVSHAGAAGMWQFMPETGRRYLRINNAIDERRNFVVATEAAARELGSLNGQVGSWLVAAIGYHSGPMTARRAVRITGGTDVAQMILTEGALGPYGEQYVPQLLAALRIFSAWEKHFKEVEPDFTPQEFYRTSRPLFLSEIEKATGLSSQEIAEHNPAFLRPILANRTPIPAGHPILLPGARGLADAVATYESTAPQIYYVQRGDTLGEIARRLGVPTDELAMLNQIESKHRISIGQALVYHSLPGATRHSFD